jgi:hypothetical protein
MWMLSINATEMWETCQPFCYVYTQQYLRHRRVLENVESNQIESKKIKSEMVELVKCSNIHSNDELCESIDQKGQ